tara:strand:- start:7842 stop:9200 length:1359 start_codon:yes stop_codon:yes gene_type:complete
MKIFYGDSNSILFLSGLSLGLLFISNVAFGNAIMVLVVFGVPLNQLILAFLFLICALFGLIRLPTGYPLLLYIWMIFGLFIWLPIGLMNHGIVAGRDATQLLDAIAFILAFSIFTKMHTQYIAIILEKLLFIGLTLEFLDRLVLFQFSDVTVASLHNVKLFGGTVGSSVIVVSAFWFGVVMRNSISTFSSRYMMLLSFILVLMLQNRFLYVGMIFTILVYFFIVRPNFLSRSLLYKIFIGILLVAIIEVYIGSFIGYLLNLLPNSDYIESNRLFKFGIESFSLSGIFDLLATGFGIENELYSGSAGGVFQRLGWWYNLMIIMFSDLTTLIFGMGYGVILTDLIGVSPIREPHNSFISVFCRNGLILFIIWIAFHLTLVWKSFGCLLKKMAFTTEHKLLLVSLLTIISTYICGVVEPAFENPPISISTYIFIGLSAVLISRIKLKERLSRSAT